MSNCIRISNIRCLIFEYSNIFVLHWHVLIYLCAHVACIYVPMFTVFMLTVFTYPCSLCLYTPVYCIYILMLSVFMYPCSLYLCTHVLCIYVPMCSVFVCPCSHVFTNVHMHCCTQVMRFMCTPSLEPGLLTGHIFISLSL